MKKGDHVVACLSVFCGCCPQCVTGHPNLCEDVEVKFPPGAARRMWINGNLMNQFANLSSFGEMMFVHENALVKIDRDIPLDRAALVGCGVLTGVGAVIHSATVRPGSTVAVIGCGGVGLSVVSGARLAGRRPYYRHRHARQQTRTRQKLGATDVINASKVDPVAAVIDMSNGGVPYSFEALGLKRRPSRPSPCYVKAGWLPSRDVTPGLKLELEGSWFISDRKIQGSSMGSNQFKVDIPNILQYYMQGRLELDHLISSHIKLTDINAGFDNLRTGAPVRQVIDMSLS